MDRSTSRSRYVPLYLVQDISTHTLARAEFPGFKHVPKRDRALQIIDKLQTQEVTLFNPVSGFVFPTAIGLITTLVEARCL
jgi:hypothetical protein